MFCPEVIQNYSKVEVVGRIPCNLQTIIACVIRIVQIHVSNMIDVVFISVYDGSETHTLHRHSDSFLIIMVPVCCLNQQRC